MGGRLVSVPRCTLVDALEVPKGTGLRRAKRRSQMETPTWTSRSIRNFSGLATWSHERRSSSSPSAGRTRSQLRIARQVGSETQPLGANCT